VTVAKENGDGIAIGKMGEFGRLGVKAQDIRYQMFLTLDKEN